MNAELLEHNSALEEQLSALQQENGELRQALFEAAQVHRKLSAPRELRRGPFEIATENFPYRYLSGDFYDVLDLDNETGLAIGDITGKGLAAGVWLTYFIGLIRMHAGSFPDPAAAVAAINHNLCRLKSEPPLASLFLTRLDTERGELFYCNAGHPPALLLRRDGEVESLQEGGPLLGAFAHASFSSSRVTMEPGDTLLAYSDGIVECRNSHDEEFDVPRLLAAARNTNRSSAAATLFSVLGAVQDFAATHPRHDDFTLMIVHRSQ